MSLFYRPSAAPSSSGGGDGGIGTGTKELSYGGLSAEVETQLNSPSDVGAAHHYFQPTGAEGLSHVPVLTPGSESAALSAQVGAHLPAVEAAAFSAHGSTAAIGALAGAGEPISPIIQLIMRLPGAVGLANSFFEFLSSMFLPGAQSLLPGFDPSIFAAGLGAHAHGAVGALGAASGEHFSVSLGLLPANAPIFQSLGHFGHNLGNGLGNFSSLDLKGGAHGLTAGTDPSGGHLSRNPLNISGQLDLKKPQFEGVSSAGGQASSLSREAAVSGPGLSANAPGSNLAGNHRLFSDQISSLKGNSSSITSQSSVPAGGSQSTLPPQLNVNGTTFGQELNQPSYGQMSDLAVSGPNISQNAGFHLGATPSPSLDGGHALGPSGAVSDKLGGQSLLASDTPIYRPTMGGYYNPQVTGSPAVSADSSYSSASSHAAGSDAGEIVKPLKARQLTFEDLHKAGAQPSSHTVMDHIGHQARGSAASPSAGFDSIAHRSLPGVQHQAHSTAGTHHAPAHHAAQGTRAPAQQVSRASSEASRPAQIDGSGQEQAESAVAPADKTQLSMNDQPAETYTVAKGDNLWDIAHKQLGDPTRWREIYNLNGDAIGSNPDLIQPGLELKMPGSQIADAAGSASKYVVQPGDNLWDIARHNLGDGNKWGDLFKANANVIGDNPRLIFPGQELAMPGAGNTIASASGAVDPGLSQAAAAGAPGAQAAIPSAPCAQAAVAPAPGSESASFGAPRMEGIPATSTGVIPTANDMHLGPGAAGAAELPPQAAQNGSGPVSSSLAPDLSFLNRRPGNQ